MAERGSFGGSRLILPSWISLCMSRKNDSKRCAGAMDVDDPRGLIARVPNRVRHARRHGRLLAGTHAAPVAVHEDLERALDDLVALLSPRVRVNGRARHPGLDPIRRLEQLAGGVGCAARDLPPHSQPGTEVEPAIVAAWRLARCGFAVVRFGHGGPFRRRPARGSGWSAGQAVRQLSRNYASRSSRSARVWSAMPTSPFV